MNKQEFLQNLKDSPYSDELINQWLETFEDDQITNQYLAAGRDHNRQWAFKKSFMSIDKFVQALYAAYTEQGLPHALIIPLMLVSCPSIRDWFIASEAMKHVKVREENGMTILDMSN